MGGLGYFRLAIGWGGAKRFSKEFQGGLEIDREIHVNRGPFTKMGIAVKQWSVNNKCETVMVNCTILC